MDTKKLPYLGSSDYRCIYDLFQKRTNDSAPMVMMILDIACTNIQNSIP